MFENDFIMREIWNISKLLEKLLHIDEEDELPLLDEEGNFSEESFLYRRLRGMCLQKQINDAENLLFEELSFNPSLAMLQVVLKFYDDLSQFSDEFLETSDFSREEILEGLSEAKKLYDSFEEAADQSMQY